MMFALRQRRIRSRIIVPFTILMGMTLLGAWLFSSYFLSRFLDQNLETRMSEAAGIISRSGYVMNPGILQQLKAVINAEIVVSDASGRVIRTTFSGEADPVALTRVLREAGGQGPGLRNLALKGEHYRCVFRPVHIPGKGDALLSLWKPAQELSHARWKAVVVLGTIALTGLAAAAGAGFLIAGTITAPLEDLARATERLSKGDWQASALPQGQDEIGRLGTSFARMVDQLREVEKRLVASEKMAAAGQMAAGLAHEIRTPLTSIKMLGQVMQKRFSGQDQERRILDSLVREIDRLDRIIRELIDRTRPGELRKVEVDLNLLITEVLDAAGEDMAARHITIKKDLAHALPQVYADPEKVKQVLWNLAINAAEAMHRGGEILASTRTADDGLVRISVEDTGTGIGEGEKARLFEPFFTTKPEGMGLGLTISRELIQKHGGSLSLENRAEGGCRAVILLPTGESPMREEGP